MSNNKNNSSSSSNTNNNNNNNDALEAIHMLNRRLQSQSRHILQNFSHHPINYQLYYQLLIGDLPPSSMAPFIYQLYYQLLIADLDLPNNMPPVFPEGNDGSHFIMNNHSHGGFSFGHGSHHADDAIMTYLRMSQNHMTMFGDDCPICAYFLPPPHPAQNYGPAIPPPPPLNNNIAVGERMGSLEHIPNEESEIDETDGTTRSFNNLLDDPIEEEEIAAKEVDLTLKL